MGYIDKEFGGTEMIFFFLIEKISYQYCCFKILFTNIPCTKNVLQLMSSSRTLPCMLFPFPNMYMMLLTMKMNVDKQ